LEATGNQLRWVIAPVPFDVASAWPVRNGRRVRGAINDFAFRTSLFPQPGGQKHVLVVNKKMQAGARAKAGDTVHIQLEPDMEERPADVPGELARALKAERGLRPWFDTLTPSLRGDIGRWVSEPRSAASRVSRAEQTAEWLLLAKEGEEETPPLLKAAFQRQPSAREGWMAMTPARRRNHLLGIFHYRSAESRGRRAQAALEDALTLARRLNLGPENQSFC
jgi:uncharacterized protein YdeI (YjbR/CyaY-like superfamily)